GHEWLLRSPWSRVPGLPASGQAGPGARFASAGQVAPDPVQFSVTSHTREEGRQTVVEDRKLSVGQAALVPVQFSATSHTPAEARQTVPEGRERCVGQVALVPVDVTATSLVPAAAPRTVPDRTSVPG